MGQGLNLYVVFASSSSNQQVKNCGISSFKSLAIAKPRLFWDQEFLPGEIDPFQSNGDNRDKSGEMERSMKAISTRIKRGLQFLLILVLILGIASCGAKPESLPAVDSLPNPTLPEWIEHISPQGQVEPLSQIRVRFQEPLIPVEHLESDAQQALLKQFEIVPPLPGQFRFLTPRLVGFQMEQALPKATRVQVTLKAGLADLNGHQLQENLTWTFNTTPIKLTNLPGKDPQKNQDPAPIELKPTLELTANTGLDLASLKKHLRLVPAGKKRGIGIKVALRKEEKSDKERSTKRLDTAQQRWVYTVQPQRELKKATQYRLEVDAGLRPLNGNLDSETVVVRKLQTYAPLSFEEVRSPAGYGRFVNGSPVLEFNNGLVAESALENISLTPEPEPVPRLLRAYDGDRIVTINPWALKPKTTYTLTIGADLKDRFGQMLGQSVKVKYRTEDLTASIWAPRDLNIFPSGQDLQLDITAVNLPEARYKAAYQVVQPTDLIYTDYAGPRGNDTDLLPLPANWPSFRVPQKKNQVAKISVPIRQQLGAETGMLAYGVQAKTVENKKDKKWRTPTFYGLVQLTNLGVFAQWFPDSGLVRVHHLSDGSPVNGAEVKIYRSQLDAQFRVRSQPCAIAITDTKGTALLSQSALQGCMEPGKQRFETPPKLLVIVQEGQDWAFTRTHEYSGDRGYGLYAGWDNGAPQSRGTIFSDRWLYQPGETAWFTGAAYYLQDDSLKQDKNARYTVMLHDPDGKKTELGTQTTNEFGTFSLKLEFKPDQPLGFYSIVAKGDNGVEIYGEFRVAEFKPPNFKVELDLDRDYVLMNQSAQARAQGTYLFGAPVAGAQVKYYVTRSPTTFTPEGWQDFAFGRQWFWPEERPEISSDVLEAKVLLDEQGNSTRTVKVTNDLPYPMRYRVDAEVTDAANLSVSGSKTFTALPSKKLIGIQSDFVADAGKPFPIKIAVTNPMGKFLASERVKVELQSMKYSSVVQLVESSRKAKNQVEYETVAEETFKLGRGPATISLTPPESGSYRIRANFVGARNDLTATEVQVWATGKTPTYWGSRYTNNRLDIKLDKDRYQPGETATMLIQSPYPEAELYFAVVRHHTIEQKIVQVTGGAPEIQFQVTPDMLPNAAVEAVLVRRGQPLSEVEPGSLDKLVRVGFAPFSTNLEDKYLTVTVTPKQERNQPGGKETVQLALKDAQGNPVAGQVTLMVANESVLQLSGYRPPDLVETVYAEQNISTRFADNRPDVVVAAISSPIEKGWGYGGGLSASGASTRIRRDFRALAYYNGSIRTNGRGKATVSFDLPDDLTTWRAMAVATDGELDFGNGDATFITTKPLLSNPVLPQFVRPSDRFQAGLAVTNTTAKKGQLAIAGKLSPPLRFEKGSKQSTTLRTRAEAGTRAYRFPMTASSIGEAKVQFITKLGRQASDAFEVSLPVKTLDVTEQAIESGTTTDAVKIPLNIAQQVVPEVGGLDISLASTLIPEIAAPAKQVLERDWFPCLEQRASQLAIATNLHILGQTYERTFEDFNPPEEVAKALERLQKLQQPDGGFAYWPSQEGADPFLTPYAAQVLARTAAAGLPVDPAMLNRLKSYLDKLIANPGKYEFCRNPRCKAQVRLHALLALDTLGDRRNDFLSEIYTQYDNLDRSQQLELIRYLTKFPEWRQEAQTRFDQVQATVYETGRNAKITYPRGWQWLGSATEAQAQALQLFIARNAKPEVLDRLLQGLLALRRDSTWKTTYDNAEALTALVVYSQQQAKPPNFTAKVRLAGKQLASQRFQGYRKPSLEVNVPMAKLPRGQHDLVLQKSGQGRLHYLTAYRYRLKGNQPGRFNGLRVTRTIRPANEDEVLEIIGLAAPDKPLAVPAGQVFDIGLEIVADHSVDRVAITDPLPAGFEAVDTSFQTANQALQAQSDSWQMSYQSIYRDRITAFADRLDPGVYQLHYLARSVTPGSFEWPGAEAQLMYAPEEFGRTASAKLEIQE